MVILCPHCHAEESRCPEQLPACRERGAERRRLYAVANGFELMAMSAGREQREVIEAAVTRALAPVLRERDAAERRCEVLRAEVERLRERLAEVEARKAEIAAEGDALRAEVATARREGAEAMRELREEREREVEKRAREMLGGE